jgi:hypothetical protein
MPTASAIGRKIVKIVEPGMTPKELIAAVRERWPHVSKKKILRSAFAALIRDSRRKTGKPDQSHRIPAQPTPTH